MTAAPFYCQNTAARGLPTHQVNRPGLSASLKQRVQPSELKAGGIKAVQQHDRRRTAQGPQLRLLLLAGAHEGCFQGRDGEGGDGHRGALHAGCHLLCCWLGDVRELCWHEGRCRSGDVGGSMDLHASAHADETLLREILPPASDG